MRLMPFAIYLVGCAVAAALLAYPVWHLLAAAGVDALPFHKLTFRLLEACALLGLWPLMAWLRLGTEADIGLGRGHAAGAWGRGRLGGLSAGLAAGVAVLAAIVLMLLIVGVRSPRAELEMGAGALLVIGVKAVLAGFAVALVEEVWFRGALQRAFEHRMGLGFAVVATAVLYALVHFIRPDVQIPAQDVSFGSSFAVIAGSFGRFDDPGILDSFMALVFVGVFLSLVRWRTGRIWECIGMHVGFVVVIRISADLTVVNRESDLGYLVGSFDGIIGVLAGGVFLLLALVYWRLGTRAPQPAE